MNDLPRRTRIGILLRSLLVQGSWNYETLIGTGFAFTLLPALRWAYSGDPEAGRAALARHAELFNSHPYLVTVAVGAVARLEAERVDPHTIDRFKNAMRGSLGSLGDQLVWGAWRPASVLLGLALVLAGAAWWLGVLAFLLVYNAMHLTLRVWGLAVGAAAGLEVARRLRDAPLQSLARRAADLGAVACGFAVVLVAAPEGFDAPRLGAAALGVGLGLWLGVRARTVLGAWVAVAWLVIVVSTRFA